jgi:predicted transcriptional regulator
MLIETKVKTRKEVDNRTIKRTITFLTDNETLVDALAAVINHLDIMQSSNLIEDADIISCKQSSIREVATQFEGDKSYVAVLKDTWIDEIGDEKSLRYKVLLYAADLTECNQRVQELSREGYDMSVESLTEVDMEYLCESQDDVDN